MESRTPNNPKVVEDKVTDMPCSSILSLGWLFEARSSLEAYRKYRKSGRVSHTNRSNLTRSPSMRKVQSVTIHRSGADVIVEAGLVGRVRPMSLLGVVGGRWVELFEPTRQSMQRRGTDGVVVRTSQRSNGGARRTDGRGVGIVVPRGTTNEHQVVNVPKCISIYWIRLEYERLGTKLIRILYTWDIWVKLYSTSIYSAQSLFTAATTVVVL